MPEPSTPFAFGPVPSRRLGRSVGINNVPPKSCSYSCIYCQVGRTSLPRIAPCTFWPPDEVIAAVRRHVEALRARGERIDALTFVPDGEPTLDRGLGAEIEGLRPLGPRIAVISNGSLLWREEVRAALGRADWVSLKVDAVDESIWRAINRPHPSLNLDAVLDGMMRFAASFTGQLATETMLVEGVNDADACLEATAGFLERLRPRIAYVAVPTRPPAEPWVRPAAEETLNRAYQRFSERLGAVELLTEFEGTAFGGTGDAVGDLLATAAIHPLREDAALVLLERSGLDASTLRRLVSEGRLRRVDYRGHAFYLHPLHDESPPRDIP